jgi:mannonate dehydratase
LDLSSPNRRGNWGGRSYTEPLSHGRVFTKDEIWENYTYFIKQVAPVAEEAGVKIGIHPDDPPAPVLAGVPRCIFGNFEGYKRAMEIANSPNVGICLCCGTWLEGGKELTDKDPEEMIRYFGARRKIFNVHFRNIRGRFLNFQETFPDDGDVDMIKAMRTYKEVGYNGMIMPDHVHLSLTPLSDKEGSFSIPQIMHAIKSESAHRINKALGGKAGYGRVNRLIMYFAAMKASLAK